MSQDKSEERVYELKVTKTDNLDSANTNLEILAIENYLIYPPFENSITEYTTEISNDTMSLNVFAVAENEQGKVEISGNDNLKEGNNIITITSTAPNGISKREYKINVYKRSVDEEERYKKEQEEQKQKLEEAYELEKTSTDNIEKSVMQMEQKENRYIVIAVIGGIILIVVILVIFIFKKNGGNTKKY